MLFVDKLVDKINEVSAEFFLSESLHAIQMYFILIKLFICFHTGRLLWDQGQLIYAVFHLSTNILGVTEIVKLFCAKKMFSRWLANYLSCEFVLVAFDQINIVS